MFIWPTSCLVPRRLLAAFKSDWDFGSALGIMGKTRLPDYDFKCKTREKEKESFRVFFSEGKVHQFVLKDKISCPHSSCEKDHSFSKETVFRSIFVWYTNVPSWTQTCKRALLLEEGFMPKKPLIFLMNFLKVEAIRQDKFLCLCDIILPQNSATETVHSPNPEIRVLWTEIEPNLRGVPFFSFTLPSVLCVHAKRSHGPLRDTL